MSTKYSDTNCSECGKPLDLADADYCEDCGEYFCHKHYKFHDCKVAAQLEGEDHDR